MNAVRLETTIETDGELHLRALPCCRGDKVEAVVRILEPATTLSPGSERELERAAALDRYLTLAGSFSFHSTGAYPSREELHDRH